ncbi:hypothetical protein EV174_002536 [Coemansia sp. RSA 2320]|nr:hypothetical protein EV174_002536 [Coemansia sp. RSA 2320]
MVDLASPRSIVYEGGEPARWSHASVIADQTMYVIGGKSNMGDAASSYATSCVSLNLASEFTTDSPPWSSSCASDGPLVAGHSVAINSDINMIIVFGGSTPADSSVAGNGSLRLFSAEIKFWSVPPKVPSNRNEKPVVSNSTLRMVTNPTKHVVVLEPPSQVDLDADPPSSASDDDMSTTQLDSDSWEPASPTNTNRTPGGSSPVATAVSSTDSTEILPSLLPASSLQKSSSSSKLRTTSSKPRTTSSKPRATSTKLNAVPSPDDSILDARALPIGFGKGANHKLARRAGDGPNLALMTWINDTLPAGVLGRIGHTSNIVSNGKMVVLGGSDGTSLVDMRTIYCYDAVTRQWTLQVATGNVPPSRRSHVSTVVNGTLIVIHGGVSADFGKALNDVAVLDTDTWTWTMPVVDNAPAARYAHAASQAGPYMLITFGYSPADFVSVAAGDSGLYILDTTIWRFVSQYDPARAGLSVLTTTNGLSGGTIFGLFVASVAGLFVLLILGYIGCMHYYNRHPRLSDSAETTSMLPTTELRNFGRRLTGRFGTRRAQRKAELHRSTSAAIGKLGGPVPEPVPVFSSGQMRYALSPGKSSLEFSLSSAPRLSNIPTGAAPDENSMRIMFDLSRESSFDQNALTDSKAASRQGESLSLAGTRYSRRTHLDDIELPAGGLRNRHNLQGAAGTVEDDASLPFFDTQSSKVTGASVVVGDGSWSRPTTSESSMERGAGHISAMLPRIVGSRLTLPAESVNALARYRFDELEDGSYELFAMSPLSAAAAAAANTGQGATIAALAERGSGGILAPDLLAPPVMPASHYEGSQSRLRLSAADDASNSPVAAPAKLSTSSAQNSAAMRDSIDISTVLSHNRQFFVVNPDD